MQKIVSDADDFMLSISPEQLINLKEHFPKFKITLFTVPYDPQMADKKIDAKKYKDWAKLINDLDWIEIGIHGYKHVQQEFNVTDAFTYGLMNKAEKIFDDAGLKYSKIFRPPYWQISESALRALAMRGYTIAAHPSWQLPNDPNMKIYTYNHRWNEEWPNWPIIKTHGHMTPGSGNGLVECWENILKMPQDSEFMTVGQYMKEKE